MTDTALDNAQSLMQEFEKDLYYLHDQRPVLTYTSRNVIVYRYFDVETGSIKEETDAQTLRSAYNQLENSLLMERSRSSVIPATYRYAAEQSLEKMQEYGIQQCVESRSVYVLNTPHGENSRTERNFLHADAVIPAIKKAYTLLRNREFQTAYRLGYDSAQHMMQDEVLRSVMEYHSLETIQKFLKQYCTSQDCYNSTLPRTMADELEQYFKQRKTPHNSLTIINYCRQYYQRLQQRYLLRHFTELQVLDKELPLSWTIGHFWDADAAETYIETMFHQLFDETLAHFDSIAEKRGWSSPLTNSDPCDRIKT